MTTKVKVIYDTLKFAAAGAAIGVATLGAVYLGATFITFEVPIDLSKAGGIIRGFALGGFIVGLLFSLCYHTEGGGSNAP